MRMATDSQVWNGVECHTRHCSRLELSSIDYRLGKNCNLNACPAQAPRVKGQLGGSYRHGSRYSWANHDEAFADGKPMPGAHTRRVPIPNSLDGPHETRFERQRHATRPGVAVQPTFLCGGSKMVHGRRLQTSGAFTESQERLCSVAEDNRAPMFGGEASPG